MEDVLRFGQRDAPVDQASIDSEEEKPGSPKPDPYRPVQAEDYLFDNGRMWHGAPTPPTDIGPGGLVKSRPFYSPYHRQSAAAPLVAYPQFSSHSYGGRVLQLEGEKADRSTSSLGRSSVSKRSLEGNRPVSRFQPCACSTRILVRSSGLRRNLSLHEPQHNLETTRMMNATTRNDLT